VNQRLWVGNGGYKVRLGQQWHVSLGLWKGLLGYRNGYQGLRNFFGRLWNFLMGLRFVNHGYRIASERLWNRSKPYRDCVKEKLKWRFCAKNGTLTKGKANVWLAGLLVQNFFLKKNLIKKRWKTYSILLIFSGIF